MQKIILMLVSLSLLFSCSKEENSKLLNEKIYAVSFQISTFTQSINDWDVPTKGDLKNIQLIRYTLYKDNARISSGYQTVDSLHFGQINLQLPAGDYRMVVIGTTLTSIGFNDTGGYTNTWMAINEGKNEDVFAKDFTFGVNQSIESNTIILERLVGRLDVVLTDRIIPPQIATIRITTNASIMHSFYTDGNDSTGEFTGITGDFNIDDSTRSQRTFSIYMLKQDTCSVQITALNFQNTAVISKNISQVQIKRNKKTVLKGSLFAQVDSVYNSIIVNDIWIDNNIELAFE